MKRLALLVVLVLAAAPAVAEADPREEARSHFRRGLTLFRSSAYAAARTEFEAAYRALPDARVLANVAACYAAERRPVLAVRTYRRFLNEAGPSLSAADRRMAEREMARLRAQTGQIALAVEPAGAEVLVDGETVGRAPL